MLPVVADFHRRSVEVVQSDAARLQAEEEELGSAREIVFRHAKQGKVVDPAVRP